MTIDSKKISLIITGGTIGSSTDNNGVLASNAEVNTPSLINSLFENQPSYEELIDFEIKRPLNILSENLTYNDWSKLILELNTIDYESVDGLIITHGTDTVAYTANLLSVLMKGIDVPVFIVASSKPLSDPNANGYDNFYKAVDMIIEGTDPGVYVPYKNKNEELTVHDGCRLIQCDDLSPNFRSAHHKLNNLDKIIKLINDNDDNDNNNEKSKPILKNVPNLNKNILVITPQPGLDYRNYDLDYVDMVLHRTYHSSTMAVDSNQSINSALYLIDKCNLKNIPFYITPVLSNSKQVYESTHKLIKRGATPLFDMTFEMSYIYLLLK